MKYKFFVAFVLSLGASVLSEPSRASEFFYEPNTKASFEVTGTHFERKYQDVSDKNLILSLQSREFFTSRDWQSSDHKLRVFERGRIKLEFLSNSDALWFFQNVVKNPALEVRIPSSPYLMTKDYMDGFPGAGPLHEGDLKKILVKRPDGKTFSVKQLIDDKGLLNGFLTENFLLNEDTTARSHKMQ
jgi:hypothetical protein